MNYKLWIINGKKRGGSIGTGKKKDRKKRK